MSYVLATTMTLTPGAGTYLAFYSTSVSMNKNSETVSTILTVNGVDDADTERQIGGQLGNLGSPVAHKKVTVADGQAIEIKWKISNNAGGGMGSMLERSLTLFKLA